MGKQSAESGLNLELKRYTGIYVVQNGNVPNRMEVAQLQWMTQVPYGLSYFTAVVLVVCLLTMPARSVSRY